MAPKIKRLGLNDLPDSLLTFILSKVPFKQAVRCSIVSKRWKSLWTFSPNVKFLSRDFDFSSWGDFSITFSRIVDRIFYLHSGPLELFDVSVIPYIYIHDKICEWIHCAALKDVREISIGGNTSSSYDDEVPTSIFLCQSLRSLILKELHLKNIPHCFDGFLDLATLDLYGVTLNDKTIELMLQICPVLENLIVCDCNGLNRLKICSDSLISLNLSDHWIEAITANCPRLVSLILIKKRLYNIVEMKFYLPACLSLCTDVAQLEMFTTLKSLRKLTSSHLISKGDVKILSEFPDLEQICIGSAGYSPARFSRDWSGAIPTFQLENLKQVHLNMTLFYDPTPLLTYLLRHAPAMKTFLVFRKEGFNGTKALRFVNGLLNLQRTSTDIKILLSANTLKEVRCLNCDLDELISESEKIVR